MPLHNRTALPHRFDVVLLCTDGTAIGYHVPTYAELLQSLVDIAPIAGTFICAVGVSLGGQALSSIFTGRALRATGIGRLIALQALGTESEAASHTNTHAWVWGEGPRARSIPPSPRQRKGVSR
jgi:hypothetical protein